MRPPEMDLPYFKRLWQGQRWKLFLTSESETQGSLSLSTLHDSIHSHVRSSSD